MSTNEIFDTLVNASQNFCDWAENEPTDTENEARIGLQNMSLLYAALLGLAGLDLPEEEDFHSEKRIPIDQWRNVYDRFEALPVTSYIDVINPLQDDDELIRTDIQEELADIYQDVAEGLALYKQGFENDGLWHWRLTFEFHWGRRLLTVMNTLHAYFEDKADWEIFSSQK
ncbi:DUF5063 domain-containing protein [Lentisphaera profundi]|uniref:DUF5063 domain-containing protein n=1 Tax=Lentisphaera profundi TaxID=1658616 RepID=A0ABY7VTU5_9BACT|nr:DUF5063 domain-containing protein [Lentisphaera profundi]WDE97623.1 DUF5063 domain-containing protein [Lentisphaera profundi]